jgi:adenylyltransferase/sulfurtransferase
MEESELAELQRLRAENAELRNRLQGFDVKPDPAQCNEQQREAAFISAHHLNASQIHRYSRQIILPVVSSLAQARICSSSALIIGCGGLGSPCAMYLAAAGVGRIGLVDQYVIFLSCNRTVCFQISCVSFFNMFINSDQVELSNLHRQIMHTERGAASNQLKALSARQTLQDLNSDITIDAHCVSFSSSNACELIAQYDIVVDCTDNAVTRYIINDAAVLCGVPLISGAAIGLEGQLTIYNYRHTNSDTTAIQPSGPCYRCLFPTPPPPETVASCGNAGVLGVVPGVIGCLQVFIIIIVFIFLILFLVRFV